MENHAFFDSCGNRQGGGIPQTPYRPVLPYDYNTDYQYQQRLLQGHPILLPVMTGPDKQEMKDMENWKSMYPASMK